MQQIKTRPPYVQMPSSTFEEIGTSLMAAKVVSFNTKVPFSITFAPSCQRWGVAFGFVKGKGQNFKITIEQVLKDFIKAKNLTNEQIENFKH